ncbi:hypothetical protein [Geminocystis sp. CENA526]|uniref:hypothetical protein n=1 Tax=Geminocystis sp. CENA526 TaxID=1355871 RepID=UPI003D6E034C
MSIMAREIWRGKGQIIRGEGEGGLLNLILEIDDNTIKFLSGPSQNQVISLNSYSSHLNNSIAVMDDTWHFQSQNSELTVTLYQKKPYRVIVYKLYTSPIISQPRFQFP